MESIALLEEILDRELNTCPKIKKNGIFNAFSESFLDRDVRFNMKLHMFKDLFGQAYYSNSRKTIYLSRKDNPETRLNLKHELVHHFMHVFYQEIDEIEDEYLEKFYDALKRKKVNRGIFEKLFCITSIHEGLAEYLSMLMERMEVSGGKSPYEVDCFNNEYFVIHDERPPNHLTEPIEITPCDKINAVEAIGFYLNEYYICQEKQSKEYWLDLYADLEDMSYAFGYIMVKTYAESNPFPISRIVDDIMGFRLDLKILSGIIMDSCYIEPERDIQD